MRDPDIRRAGHDFDRALLTYRPGTADHLLDRALDWLWVRTEVEDVNPVLVTNDMRSDVPALLDRVRHLGGHLSPRSQIDFGSGPVVAYHPTAKSLRVAERLDHEQ